ncbi:hypothetical protein GCM10027431_08000 [Lysobacter rhizosphaerae]
MSLTLAKLQQLKRQAGGSAPATVPPPPSSSTSIDALRQLLRVRAPAVTRVTSHDRALPGSEIAPGLFLREERICDDAVPDQFCGAFDRKEALPTANLLCFDTETTGLAGGTGTRAFMIGAADWFEGGLRIRQLTIANMAAEASMLDAFRTWLAPGTILVSYNGKCYDAPLLATRYRLARRANPLAGLLHVDLLYPARRRWRGVYENCRLATIERQVLRVLREDDLPGSEAPAAWLSYLRGSSAHTLRRVLAHNHQDVVSLARLLRHLSAMGEADTAASVTPGAAVLATMA